MVMRLGRVRRELSIVVVLSVLGGVSSAQSGAAQPEGAAVKLPVYDVATIKLNNSGGGGVDVRSDRDSYMAKNIPLKGLLNDAYEIREDLISGVPGPVDSARFDVQARVSEVDPDALKKLSSRERRAMLIPVLEERFGLKTHMETKTLAVYELVVVPGGPKFSPSADPTKTGGGSTRIRSTAEGGQEMTAHDLPMKSLVNTLAYQVHRTVIDKTGLEGSYDLNLKWTREDGTGASATDADAGPSIFTALQEQLGLKLVPAKGPVETLVVDHAEMPSEN